MSSCISLWFVILSIVYNSVYETTALDISACNKALGMESGTIPDSAISASSSYDSDLVGPQSARCYSLVVLTSLYQRIRTELRGGAWCPRPSITDDTYEYLQIDFPDLHIITNVETQGRFNNGQGQEFVKHYKLEYQRGETSQTDRDKWIRYRNRNGIEIIRGNENTYLSIVRNLDPPIIANRIRFIPYAVGDPYTACMRVELYGCQSLDGLVSYSMPQGDDGFGVSGEALHDFTFDGALVYEYLSRGIGQLYDGVTSGSQSEGAGSWVGWRNFSPERNSVEIIFEFDHPRVFHKMNLSCSNEFSEDVMVFRRAEIYFSMQENDDWGSVVNHHYIRDEYIEYPRTVIVALHDQVGQYIKVALYFQDNWILINEVSFSSRLADKDDFPTTEEFTYGGNSFEVSEKVKASFDENGFIIIRNLFDAEELSKVKKVIENPDVLKYEYGRPDRHGKQPKLILWQHPGDDVTGMVAKSEKVAKTCEKLLGGEVYHYHTKLVTKEPYIGGTFEWHQDYGYWYKYNCLFPDMMTVWVAVDNCQKSNGCLQVLRGSHKCGRIDHLIEGEQTCADSNRVEEIFKQCELIHAELKPGDALFFHCNLLHSSGDNISENIRRALVIAFNRASNDPGPHEQHPGYVKMPQVSNNAVIECTNFTDFTGKEFWEKQPQV